MSSILRACMSNMLLRMRDKACDARLRRCRMLMAVSRAAFCLLTIVAMTGLWGWSFEPFAIVGWNAGLPVISWLSCADVAGLLMLALLAAWWLAAPARRALFRFGMRLWKSDLLVVLPAVILLLRGSALWGSLFLLVGCALWLPLAVSHVQGGLCSTCSLPLPCRGFLALGAAAACSSMRCSSRMVPFVRLSRWSLSVWFAARGCLRVRWRAIGGA